MLPFHNKFQRHLQWPGRCIPGCCVAVERQRSVVHYPRSWRTGFQLLQFGAARPQHFLPTHRLPGWWLVRDVWLRRYCALALCRSHGANSTLAGLLLVVLVTRRAVLIAVGVGRAAFFTMRRHLRGYRIAERRKWRPTDFRIAFVHKFFRRHNPTL